MNVSTSTAWAGMELRDTFITDLEVCPTREDLQH